ncbi:MAG: sulfate reduction electron transfer complex DsrMKJOP subunit DsrO [Acidiferrobacteraceae bacterium]
MSINRRQFLGAAAAAFAATALAPGFHLVELALADSPEQGASVLKRWGLLIDTAKCSTGCDACVTACNKANGLVSHNRPETDSQWIRKVTLRGEHTGYVQSLPVMCQHCANAPCVDVCPTGASFKRADGIVLVDRHLCIGCRYCMMACPYKARSFVAENITGQIAEVPRGKGCVEGCTLCVERIDRNKIPACVEACNETGGKAMMFGDLKDPESLIAKQLASQPSTEIRADLDLDTGVRYQHLDV